MQGLSSSSPIRSHSFLRLMRFCLRGVLQFVIIKPIVAVIDIIMIATDNKSKLGYEIFVFIVYNIRSPFSLSASLQKFRISLCFVDKFLTLVLPPLLSVVMLGHCTACLFSIKPFQNLSRNSAPSSNLHRSKPSFSRLITKVWLFKRALCHQRTLSNGMTSSSALKWSSSLGY
jgi:hypothetical protein